MWSSITFTMLSMAMILTSVLSPISDDHDGDAPYITLDESAIAPISAEEDISRTEHLFALRFQSTRQSEPLQTRITDFCTACVAACDQDYTGCRTQCARACTLDIPGRDATRVATTLPAR